MGMKFWGLDIGSTGIKVVESTRTWQGYRVTNFWSRPLPRTAHRKNWEEELPILQEIFTTRKRGSEGLILAIGSNRTMVRHSPLPFPERKKNLKVIKFEVESLLPMPADHVVVDYYPAQDTAGAKSTGAALIFALAKQEIHDRLELMNKAGLDPESVVPEAVALFWATRHLKKPTAAGAEALLDLGCEKATLIIYQGGTLVLTRSIPYRGAALLQAQKRDTPETIPFEKIGEETGENKRAPSSNEVFNRLADEVLRVLAAYGTGPGIRPVQSIFLTGGLCQHAPIEKLLGDRMPHPVKILETEGEPSLAAIPKEQHHQFMAAWGASLWGMAGEEERINFRQGEFAWAKKAAKEKSRLNFLVAYAIILSVLAISVLTTQLYLKEKRYREFKKEIRQEFLQANPGGKRVVNEIQQMKGLVREEKARLDALGRFSGSSPPLEILREISTLFDPGLKIRITDLVVNPESVEISGEADSFEAVNRLKAKLDRYPHYRDVQLKTVQSGVMENVIEFKLQMERGT
jgi:type IV pilus assembly protein PilM